MPPTLQNASTSALNIGEHHHLLVNRTLRRRGAQHRPLPHPKALISAINISPYPHPNAFMPPPGDQHGRHRVHSNIHLNLGDQHHPIVIPERLFVCSKHHTKPPCL